MDALDHEDFRPDRDPGIHLPADFDPIATGPLSFFRLFFSVAVLESIVKFTNLYAVHHVVDSPSYGDKHGAWKDTNLEEPEQKTRQTFEDFCQSMRLAFSVARAAINAAHQHAFLCLSTDRNCWSTFHSDAFNPFR